MGPRLHRRPRRLAARGRLGPRRAAAGADRDGRRPLLRDGPRPALGADAEGARRDHARRMAPRTHDRVAKTCRRSYEAGITDEFLEPIVVDGAPAARAAATRRSSSTSVPTAAGSSRRSSLEAGFDLTTMTRYSDELDVPVAFGEQVVEHTLAETLAAAGARQLHVAETEKYAHVTYFFNGGASRRGRGRRGSSSRARATCRATTTSRRCPRARSRRGSRPRSARATGSRSINFANPDMVGHTGSIPAVTTAVEVADECLGAVVEATHAAGGVCLVTADHGNAEQMLEPDGVSPHTAHTTNPVPLIVTSPRVTWLQRGRRALRSGAYGPAAPGIWTVRPR